MFASIEKWKVCQKTDRQRRQRMFGSIEKWKVCQKTERQQGQRMFASIEKWKVCQMTERQWVFQLFANPPKLRSFVLLKTQKMIATTAVDEIVNFIASDNPERVLAFKASPATKKRVFELIDKSKSIKLNEQEQAELNHYLELEHLMRLAKIRAYQMLNV